jgi:hypothetical protein
MERKEIIEMARQADAKDYGTAEEANEACIKARAEHHKEFVRHD